MELGLRAAWLARFGARSVIAGSAPNVVAVILTALIFAVVKGHMADATPLRLVASSVVAMTAYEIAQIWMPGRTFDPLDLVATLIGGMVAYPLLSIPYRLTMPRDEDAAETRS
jgi:VanZ family protein